MQVIVTDRAGDVAEYSVEEFSDLFTQLGDEMKIDALCGGCCSCATCHIYTDASDAMYLSDCDESERDVLDGLLHVRDGSRLLCQLSLKEKMKTLKITIAQSE
ncbi:ferredoxin [Zhongshania aliphaticivorans]|uniref:ferredoxin n=1 Tax=Zhongshania aliphaticivorans TaxID=1470434 RepID=UPI0012E664CF|nr:ferredoxin [Zhongshania aliphaticivorans]CAA0106170.1 Ferredoxin CarAc [Zhongshania aliphaticivorans]